MYTASVATTFLVLSNIASSLPTFPSERQFKSREVPGGKTLSSHPGLPSPSYRGNDETLRHEDSASFAGAQSLSQTGNSNQDPPCTLSCHAVSHLRKAECDLEGRDNAFCSCNLGRGEVLVYYPKTGQVIKLSEEELVALSCYIPLVSLADRDGDLEPPQSKRSRASTRAQEGHRREMHAHPRTRRCVGCDKGTIIGATVGGVFVILFLSVGAYMYFSDPLGLHQYYAHERQRTASTRAAPVAT